jgi:endonuclease YncB( thermonuclease family)
MLRICLLFLLISTAQFVVAEPLEGRATVIDGDTLAIGDQKIRLFGIDAPERGQLCKRGTGETWPCGEVARDWAADLIDAEKVTCVTQDIDRFGRLVAQCAFAGQDVGEALVTAGYALAFRSYSDLYVAAEAEAQRLGQGIWSSSFDRPSEYRAAQQAIRTAANAPNPDCVIKGNISSGKRLYHVPGSRWYARTGINLSKGERWFCTEAEAQAAGWRAAKG